MKLRAAFYLLLVFSFSFTLSLSSSAADEELNEIVFDDYGSYQEYLYFDFKPDDIVVYEPYVDALGNVYDNSYSSHALSEPRYPNFDINKINLDTIPQDIQNIIYSDNCGIVIRVWSNSYRVHVTRDCNFFFQLTRDESSGISTRNHASVGIATSNYGYDGYAPVCYYASYDFNGNLISNWSEASPLAFTSEYQNTALETRMKIFLYPFPADSDIYYCGTWSNMKGTPGSSGRSMSVGGSGSTSTITYATQFSSKPSSTAEIYISSDLTFPSYESQSLEVDRSIFSKLADIPDLIAEKIKSLFIPEEGYFDQFQLDLDTLLSENLGFIFEAPKFILDLLRKFIYFEPVVDDYTMTFPALSVPVVTNGEVEWLELTEEKHFDFDFLENQPFSTLYSFYTMFCWVIFITFLINLAIKRYREIMGVASDDS